MHDETFAHGDFGWFTQSYMIKIELLSSHMMINSAMNKFAPGLDNFLFKDHQEMRTELSSLPYSNR